MVFGGKVLRDVPVNASHNAAFIARAAPAPTSCTF